MKWDLLLIANINLCIYLIFLKSNFKNYSWLMITITRIWWFKKRVFDKLCSSNMLIIKIAMYGGWSRNRTGVNGFAGRCITTLPSSQNICSTKYALYIKFLCFRMNLNKLMKNNTPFVECHLHWSPFHTESQLGGMVLWKDL